MKKLLIAVLAATLVLVFSVGAWAIPSSAYDQDVNVKARLNLSSGLLNLTFYSGNPNPYWNLPDPKGQGRYFTKNNVIQLQMDSDMKWEIYAQAGLGAYPSGATSPGAIADMRAAFEMKGTESYNGGLFSLNTGANWYCYKSPFKGPFASRSSADAARNMRVLVSYRWDRDDIGQDQIPPPGVYQHNIIFRIVAV